MNSGMYPPKAKKEVGQKLNSLKTTAQEKYNLLRGSLGSSGGQKLENDLTRPAFPFPSGSRHPISVVRREIISIFSRLGFLFPKVLRLKMIIMYSQN